METEVLTLNPFPGLRAFEEEEDILFFGREKQIDELLRKLRTSRFLAIIGSSGSGKSSLVKSGLLPSLHSGLMSGVGSQWRVALFRPGNDPIGQMNLALCKDGVLRDEQTKEERETNTLINEAILRRSNLGLIESYKQSGLDKRNNLLVLVDQFEEIFRFSKYEKESGDGKRDSIAFINLLLKAAEQKELPIYVVFTMRSDFLGDCTEFRGLPEAINEGQYLVPRMTRDERRDAITGPIAVANGAITPALVNRLLNDVGDNPDQLPILQHAMMRTWNEWKGRNHPDVPMDIDDYEDIGTISEALSQHAEEAYAELATDRQRQICEAIFKELTDKGGMSSGIRRPRLVSELCAAAGASREDVIKVIELFRKPGRGFLMPAYPAPLTDNTIVDISHESIMRVWKRLITWLEEEEEAAQIYMHLCEAVDLYEAGKGGLWRDPELQIAIKWKEEQNKNAAWASRYNSYFDKVMFFLEHSRQQRDLEVKHKEELQKQRLRVTRRVTMIVSIIALAAFMLAIFAYDQRNKATRAQVQAKGSRDSALMAGDMAVKSARFAEQQRLEAEKQKASADSNAKVAVGAEKEARKQEQIAKDQQVLAEQRKIEADTNASIAKRKSEEANINAQRATANEKLARDREQDANLQKMMADKRRRRAESKNVAHRAQMRMNDTDYNNSMKMSLQAYKDFADSKEGSDEFQDNDIYNALYLSWQYDKRDQNIFKQHTAPVRALAGVPGLDIVISGDERGRILVSRNNGGVLEVINGKGTETHDEIRSLTVDPTGTQLLAVLLHEAVVFTLGSDYTLKKSVSVKFTGNGRHGAFFGKYMLVQSSSGITRFDRENAYGKVDSAIIPNCGSLVMAPGGRMYIASGAAIGEYDQWTLPLRPAKTFTLPAAVTSICVDNNGHYLAAGTSVGGIWITSLAGKKMEETSSSPHRSAVNDVKLCSLDGTHMVLASASSDKSLRLTPVDADKGLVTNDQVTLQDHTGWVYSVFYLPHSKFLFSASEDRSVIGWPATMTGMFNTLSAKK